MQFNRELNIYFLLDQWIKNMMNNILSILLFHFFGWNHINQIVKFFFWWDKMTNQHNVGFQNLKWLLALALSNVFSRSAHAARSTFYARTAAAKAFIINSGELKNIEIYSAIHISVGDRTNRRCQLFVILSSFMSRIWIAV